MKHFRYIFYLCALSLLISCSCNGSKNYVPKQEPIAALRSDTIPDGAIPFHYFNDTIKAILIDAVLNGKDTITMVWDTGAGSTYIPLAYRDSLKGKDSISLKLGGQTIIYREKYIFSDLKPLENEESVILGNWDLFRDKIVQISYDQKYIRVLDSTDGLEEYERISYKHDARTGHLYIPISLCVQGKVFHIEDALLDTGFSGTLVVYEKDIPEINIPPRKDFPKSKNYWISLDRKILADSIKTAGTYSTDIDIYIATPNPGKVGKRRFPNLLGLGFFERFSVVFDFKNHNLYLKPLQ